MKFIAPALRVSEAQLQEAPPYVPVLYDGEHVVDARFDGEAYVFNLSRGTLEDALMRGDLAARVRFRDEPVPSGRTKRFYTSVELVTIRECSVKTEYT